MIQDWRFKAKLVKLRNQLEEKQANSERSGIKGMLTRGAQLPSIVTDDAPSSSLCQKIDNMFDVIEEFNQKSGFNSTMSQIKNGLAEDKIERLTQELTQITNFSTLKFERMDLDNKRLRNEMLNV
jgi:uncharacterized protein YjbI with pentapeptide repeats